MFLYTTESQHISRVLLNGVNSPLDFPVLVSSGLSFIAVLSTRMDIHSTRNLVSCSETSLDHWPKVCGLRGRLEVIDLGIGLLRRIMSSTLQVIGLMER